MHIITIITTLMTNNIAIIGCPVTFYLPVKQVSNGVESDVDLSIFDDISVLIMIGYEGVDIIKQYELSGSQLSIHDTGVLELKMSKADTLLIPCETSKDVYYSVVLTSNGSECATDQALLIKFVKQAFSTL